MSPSASSSVERGLDWWLSICHYSRLDARNGPEDEDDDEDEEEEGDVDGCNCNSYLKIFYICMKDEVKVNEYYPVGEVEWKYLISFCELNSPVKL